MSNRRQAIEFKEYVPTAEEVSYEALFWKDYLLQRIGDWQNSHFQESQSKKVTVCRHIVENTTFYIFKSLRQDRETLEIKIDLQNQPGEMFLFDTNCTIGLLSQPEV